jgi:protein-tyrosine phosphatase
VAADFERFDFVLVMDGTNLADAGRVAPSAYPAEFRRFLEFAPETGERDVPDPYYGSEADFERVLDLAEAGSRGLLRELQDRSGKSI